MSPAYTPDGVLSEIPGWEGAETCELAGGMTNRSYLVEQGARRAVLKIDSGPRTLPYNSREAEATIQMAAEEHGLAGRPIFAASTVYLTEYIEGVVWTRTDLDNDRNLVDLANAVRRLHALPPSGRLFDAKLAAQKYLEKSDAAGTSKSRRCMDIIDSMPAPQNACCCHNDLVVENIIATPDLRFIDWEYACDNDPFFDLATIVAHHELPEWRSKILMEAYFSGHSVQWHEQLELQVSFYNALNYLWLAARA